MTKKSKTTEPEVGYRFKLGMGIGLAVVSIGAMCIDLINNWSYGREYSLLLAAMLGFAAFCVVALPVSASVLGWNWQRRVGTVVCVSLTVLSGFSAYLAKEPTITPLAEFMAHMIGKTELFAGTSLTIVTTSLCILITQIVALMAGDAFALIGSGLKERQRLINRRTQRAAARTAKKETASKVVKLKAVK